jgi:hypothetical protein
MTASSPTTMAPFRPTRSWLDQDVADPTDQAVLTDDGFGSKACKRTFEILVWVED